MQKVVLEVVIGVFLFLAVNLVAIILWFDEVTKRRKL
jgi:hypothetical protein